MHTLAELLSLPAWQRSGATDRDTAAALFDALPDTVLHLLTVRVLGTFDPDRDNGCTPLAMAYGGAAESTTAALADLLSRTAHHADRVRMAGRDV